MHVNFFSEGFFSPDIAKYAQLCRKAKHKDYRYQQQRYYSNILREILVNRQVSLQICLYFVETLSEFFLLSIGWF